MVAAIAKVIFAGGGTGGHVVPALALADAFRARDPDTEVVFVGTQAGLEATLVPARGWRLELVPGARLVGTGLFGKLRGAWRLLAGLRAAISLLRAERPTLVVGVGGYASGAAVLAARWLGIPTAIHESNAVPGLTNEVLGALVDRVYVGFEAATPAFSRDATVVSGNPVRAAIARVGDARRQRGGSLRRLLVVGGSQGSAFLNARVPELVATLQSRDLEIEVLHQVGRLDAADVVQAYARIHVPARVTPFIDDMAAAYEWADVAVTRAGASTIAELCAAALPALLVPFPFAARDHQAANAQAFAAAGAGWWVRQADWDAGRHADTLVPVLTSAARWADASRAAHGLSYPDAAGFVAADCADWLREAA